jgi:hypothetical protein
VYLMALVSGSRRIALSSSGLLDPAHVSHGLPSNLRKRSVISVYERPAARSEIRKARDATARRVVTASAAKLKFRPHLHQSED